MRPVAIGELNDPVLENFSNWLDEYELYGRPPSAVDLFYLIFKNFMI